MRAEFDGDGAAPFHSLVRIENECQPRNSLESNFDKNQRSDVSVSEMRKCKMQNTWDQLAHIFKSLVIRSQTKLFIEMGFKLLFSSEIKMCKKKKNSNEIQTNNDLPNNKNYEYWIISGFFVYLLVLFFLCFGRFSSNSLTRDTHLICRIV